MSSASESAGTAADNSLLSRFLYWICKNSLRAVALVWNRISAQGLEARKFQGPLVIVANHASNLDPPYIGCLAPKRLYYLSKKELCEKPILRWLVPRLNAIPIDREGSDRRALRTCVNRLREGNAVVLFPEGKRSEDGSLGKGRPGAGMIAAMAGARYLPVCIFGSNRAMPRGAAFIRPAKIRVIYGEPRDLPTRGPEMGSKEYYQKVTDAMMSDIAALKEAQERLFFGGAKQLPWAAKSREDVNQ